MFVISDGKLPIKVWSHGDIADFYGDPGVYAQSLALANHPLTYKWVALMPDFHKGFGMPIGGVVATQGGVIPNAVGKDIGCGMIAIKTDIHMDFVEREQLERWRTEVHRRVPCGQGREHQNPVSSRLLDELDPDRFFGRSMQYSSEPVEKLLKSYKASYQIGTLGAGNHFIELQKDDDDMMWLMLHSGSRYLGDTTCQHFDKRIARGYMSKFHVHVDPELAFLPDSVPEYQQYIAAMKWCMRFAEINRAMMASHCIDIINDIWGNIKIDFKIETHHNFAAMENHYGENVLVHRKGAVKAKGYVTIPGSMGTASYIAEGLENPMSFCSCSHGAGRVLSRTQAKALISHEDAVKQMGDVVFGVRQGDYDEMPKAYKDIDSVMAAQEDLARPYKRLLPIAVAKG